MPVSITEFNLTEDDRRRLREQECKPWRKSPVVPGVGCMLGIGMIAAAFWVWRDSMEGAAACVFFGANVAVVCGWVANERRVFRRWQAERLRKIEGVMAGGKGIEVRVEASEVRIADEFEMEMTAALFRVSDREHVLVTETALCWFAGLSEEKLPLAFTIRMLPEGTLIDVTPEPDAIIAGVCGMLSSERLERLGAFVEGENLPQGVFAVVPNEVVVGGAA